MAAMLALNFFEDLDNSPIRGMKCGDCERWSVYDYINLVTSKARGDEYAGNTFRRMLSDKNLKDELTCLTKNIKFAGSTQMMAPINDYNLIDYV